MSRPSTKQHQRFYALTLQIGEVFFFYLKEWVSSFNDLSQPSLASESPSTHWLTILYKESFTMPYLRCLEKNEANYTLKEIHEGICGHHLEWQALAHKAFKHGFCCPTMRKDATEFILHVINAKSLHERPSNPLKASRALWLNGYLSSGV